MKKRIAHLTTMFILTAGISLADLAPVYTLMGPDPQHNMRVRWSGADEVDIEWAAEGEAPHRMSAQGAEALLTDLRPGTRYSYRITALEDFSKEGRFTTAPEVSETFTFAVIGDVQGKGASDAWRELSAWLADRKPAFWMPVGDLVDTGLDETQWQHFFADGEQLFLTAPIVPVVGNHDTYAHAEEEGKRHVSRYPQYFMTYFPHPAPDGEGRFDGWYDMHYGSTHLLVLNAYAMPLDEHADARAYEQASRARQDAWAREQLADSPAPWRVLALHPPIYSSGPHGVSGDGPYEKSVVELADTFGAAVVFSGHTHAFEITKPLYRHQRTEAEQPGTIYYNTAGINYSGAAKGDWFSDFFSSETRKPRVALVTVSPETLRIETWDWQANELLHTRTLTR